MVTEKKEQAEKKPRKEARPPKEGDLPTPKSHLPARERVKELIEEKMEKIREQELAGAGEEKAQKPKAAKTKEEKREPKPKELPKSAFVTGKRKRAIARASFRQGKGVIRVNSIPLELVQPEMLRLKMMEPLMILGDGWKRFDVKIDVKGGGPTGQADAVRQVLARGLSELLGEEARKAFLSYDRNLIVYDPRRTETHKPPHSSWGARRYKQRSKR